MARSDSFDSGRQVRVQRWVDQQPSSAGMAGGKCQQMNVKQHVQGALLLLGLGLYTLLGGWLFSALERGAERRRYERAVNQTASRRAALLRDIVDMHQSANQTNQPLNTTQLTLSIANFDAASNVAVPEDMRWDLRGGSFYAMTLYTTIGYGTYTCQTGWGRAATVLYALIGIPYCLGVLGVLGSLLDKAVQWLVKLVYRKWGAAEGAGVVHMTVVVLVLLLAGGIALYSAVHCALEPDPQYTYRDWLYYSFITVTTIGLGDLMPVNTINLPMLLGLLLGLSLLASLVSAITAVCRWHAAHVSNRVQQLAKENLPVPEPLKSAHHHHHRHHDLAHKQDADRAHQRSRSHDARHSTGRRYYDYY